MFLFFLSFFDLLYAISQAAKAWSLMRQSALTPTTTNLKFWTCGVISSVVIVSAVKMNLFTNADMTGMHFVYGLANGNWRNAAWLYAENFLPKLPPVHTIFPRVHQMLSERKMFAGRMEDTENLDQYEHLQWKRNCWMRWNEIRKPVYERFPQLLENLDQRFAVFYKARNYTPIICKGWNSYSRKQGYYSPWLF